MTTTVLDNIGVLVTNSDQLGDGPLGVLENAAVVYESGVIVEIGSAGLMADERLDARGMCVDPGIRRLSHSPRVRRRSIR